MTDNETNLAKWTAFARSTDPEAVGHTLNELAGEIGRLRKLCKRAADEIDTVLRTTIQANSTHNQLGTLACNLANEGSKDGK